MRLLVLGCIVAAVVCLVALVVITVRDDDRVRIAGSLEVPHPRSIPLLGCAALGFWAAAIILGTIAVIGGIV